VKHIRQHFFGRDKRAIERDNAASRLWWMAFLCQRVPALATSEALQVLLYRSDVRVNIIERPTASQSIVVFGAILKTLHASYVGQKCLFERDAFRPFMRRINSIGGVKLLDCLSETQITELIDHVVAVDLKLTSSERLAFWRRPAGVSKKLFGIDGAISRPEPSAEGAGPWRLGLSIRTR
jgi:hypothetical protein